MSQARITLIGPSGDVTFWEVAAKVSRVICQEGSTLKETTVDDEGKIEIATITDQAVSLAEMSMDAARLYFTSRAELDGSGHVATGELSLYLLEREASARAGAGELSFIATLSELDLPQGTRLLAPEAQPNKNGRAGR